MNRIIHTLDILKCKNIDNLATLEALETFCKSTASQKKVNVFLKVDCGYG